MYRDTPPTPGFYVYEMELFFVDDTNVHTSSGFTINPIVVNTETVAPTVPTQPELVSPAEAVRGMTNAKNVEWSVASDNKQASAYELQRIQVHPTKETAWQSMGTTTAATDGSGYSMTVDVPEDGSRHEYRIVPITLQRTRAIESVSAVTIFPVVPPAMCQNHVGVDTAVGQLQIYPDILGYPGNAPEIAFLYDVYGMTEDKEPCTRMNPEDFYMQRLTYYFEAQDESCAIPAKPCVVTDLQKDANGDYVGGTVERVDATGVQWGFPHYRLVYFHDKTLKDGTFGVAYQVCGQGTQGVICSNWHGAGQKTVGVEPTERQFPDITKAY